MIMMRQSGWPKRILLFVLAACIAGGLSVVGQAADGSGAKAGDTLFDILDPPVAYAADFQVISGRQVIQGLVFHTLGKGRYEYDLRGEKYILLLRRDRNLAYWLIPARRLCVILSVDAIGQAGGGLEKLTLTRSDDGSEKIDGMDTRRFKLTGEGPGVQFAGTIWENTDGIVVKVIGESSSFKKGTSVEMTMSNILMQPQKDSLFEVPAGFIELAMQNMDLAEINRLLSSFSGGKKK